MVADECLGGMKSARTHRVPLSAGGFDSHVDIIFGTGATGRCDLLPSSGVNDETYTLFGDDRCITFTMPWLEVESKAELWENGKLVDSAAWPLASAALNFGIYQEAAAFIAAIQEGRKPRPSAEEAVESTSLAEAVLEGRDWHAVEET
jgi:predicted dehydrogenase